MSVEIDMSGLGEEIVKKGGRKKGEDNFWVVGFDGSGKAVAKKSFYSDVVDVYKLSVGELKKVSYRAYRIGKVDNVDKEGWKDVVSIKFGVLKKEVKKEEVKK